MFILIIKYYLDYYFNLTNYKLLITMNKTKTVRFVGITVEYIDENVLFKKNLNTNLIKIY